MAENSVKNALIVGICLVAGLGLLGYLLGSSAIRYKEYERSVTAKGLSERELPADIAIWPIQFTGADNDLGALYGRLESDSRRILAFLTANGFEKSEITLSAPAIFDKLAQQYGGGEKMEIRYTASQTVTVYSEKIDLVRSTMNQLVDLGKEGIVISGGNYENRTEFLFTRLNDVKPEMIEEATRQAREVAEKFARDSRSGLGKIKRANQGQFSITDRDKNTPHIKKIRVVSTIEYYLSD
jgi:hypothetical protein